MVPENGSPGLDIAGLRNRRQFADHKKGRPWSARLDDQLAATQGGTLKIRPLQIIVEPLKPSLPRLVISARR